MESASNSSARRSEDIALDLLKFIAPHANVGRVSSASSGFGPPTAAKSDEQVAQLLDLYTRCREAVESSVPSQKK
jgi:hypothetical protein